MVRIAMILLLFALSIVAIARPYQKITARQLELVEFIPPNMNDDDLSWSPRRLPFVLQLTLDSTHNIKVDCTRDYARFTLGGSENSDHHRRKGDDLAFIRCDFRDHQLWFDCDQEEITQKTRPITVSLLRMNEDNNRKSFEFVADGQLELSPRDPDSPELVPWMTFDLNIKNDGEQDSKSQRFATAYVHFSDCNAASMIANGLSNDNDRSLANEIYDAVTESRKALNRKEPRLSLSITVKSNSFNLTVSRHWLAPWIDLLHEDNSRSVNDSDQWNLTLISSSMCHESMDISSAMIWDVLALESILQSDHDWLECLLFDWKSSDKGDQRKLPSYSLMMMDDDYTAYHSSELLNHEGVQCQSVVSFAIGSKSTPQCFGRNLHSVRDKWFTFGYQSWVNEDDISERNHNLFECVTLENTDDDDDSLQCHCNSFGHFWIQEYDISQSISHSGTSQLYRHSSRQSNVFSRVSLTSEHDQFFVDWLLITVVLSTVMAASVLQCRAHKIDDTPLISKRMYLPQPYKYRFWVLTNEGRAYHLCTKGVPWTDKCRDLMKHFVRNEMLLPSLWLRDVGGNFTSEERVSTLLLVVLVTSALSWLIVGVVTSLWTTLDTGLVILIGSSMVTLIGSIVMSAVKCWFKSQRNLDFDSSEAASKLAVAEYERLKCAYATVSPTFKSASPVRLSVIHQWKDTIARRLISRFQSKPDEKQSSPVKTIVPTADWDQPNNTEEHDPYSSPNKKQSKRAVNPPTKQPDWKTETDAMSYQQYMKATLERRDSLCKGDGSLLLFADTVMNVARDAYFTSPKSQRRHRSQNSALGFDFDCEEYTDQHFSSVSSHNTMVNHVMVTPLSSPKKRVSQPSPRNVLQLSPSMRRRLSNVSMLRSIAEKQRSEREIRSHSESSVECSIASQISLVSHTMPLDDDLKPDNERSSRVRGIADSKSDEGSPAKPQSLSSNEKEYQMVVTSVMSSHGSTGGGSTYCDHTPPAPASVTPEIDHNDHNGENPLFHGRDSSADEDDDDELAELPALPPKSEHSTKLVSRHIRQDSPYIARSTIMDQSPLINSTLDRQSTERSNGSMFLAVSMHSDSSEGSDSGFHRPSLEHTPSTLGRSDRSMAPSPVLDALLRMQSPSNINGVYRGSHSVRFCEDGSESGTSLGFGAVPSGPSLLAPSGLGWTLDTNNMSENDKRKKRHSWTKDALRTITLALSPRKQSNRKRRGLDDFSTSGSSQSSSGSNDSDESSTSSNGSSGLRGESEQCDSGASLSALAGDGAAMFEQHSILSDGYHTGISDYRSHARNQTSSLVEAVANLSLPRDPFSHGSIRDEQMIRQQLFAAQNLNSLEILSQLNVRRDLIKKRFYLPSKRVSRLILSLLVIALLCAVVMSGSKWGVWTVHRSVQVTSSDSEIKSREYDAYHRSDWWLGCPEYEEELDQRLQDIRQAKGEELSDGSQGCDSADSCDDQCSRVFGLCWDPMSESSKMNDDNHSDDDGSSESGTSQKKNSSVLWNDRSVLSLAVFFAAMSMLFVVFEFGFCVLIKSLLLSLFPSLMLYPGCCHSKSTLSEWSFFDESIPLKIAAITASSSKNDPSIPGDREVYGNYHSDQGLFGSMSDETFWVESEHTGI